MKKITALLLSLAMLFSVAACATETVETPEETPETIEIPAVTAVPDSAPPVEATPEPTVEPEPEIDPIAAAEAEILANVEYRDGFVTEAEFYDTLRQLLALHDAEMTEYPGDTAYYYFNYDNVEDVRLLTISKTLREIETDRAAAIKGETEEEEEDASEEPVSFDPDKDVTSSTDYVTSFVMTAGTGSMDQQFMFLVSACVWCIFHPDYQCTDDAFAYLWRALFTLYGNSEGQSVSTVAGIDPTMSFTVPGNGVEAWMGTSDNGNYIVAITVYATYDELIDVAGTTGTSLDSSGLSSLLG